MRIAAEILFVAVLVLSSVFVLGLFVWAAIKDGQDDRERQERLGIRRWTRLGR